MNATAPTSAAHEQHWLSFRIGAQLYATPLADVSEVIRDGDLTPVPGAAADLLGVRHLRGRIVPVMDGRRRLGLPPSPAADPLTVRIVMLAHAGQQVGLLVDAVGELLGRDGREIAPPPPGRADRRDDPVSGVLAWQGGFVALLDVRRLCRLGGENGDVA
ncbi:chemotaxis protein CheW [Rhodanobacter denitrificans]|uniref:Chemotaxis protein CheW n=1 Tax=Rhodanobacter denitrificans TaxID=666685 RepID=A0A368KER0_9GAMM|nr:chemotaxis protein CheW [Rhodanobacter denitrificans]RCS30404.1 chemotaxis protein CheW [Rhodanobacter denitrificans]